ncbi:unnamed protein product [Pedinophyceae sp. YPF-701]|nr:unnamed protein product [Pedinophyceae sp. YPF-701]
MGQSGAGSAMETLERVQQAALDNWQLVLGGALLVSYRRELLRMPGATFRLVTRHLPDAVRRRNEICVDETAYWRSHGADPRDMLKQWEIARGPPKGVIQGVKEHIDWVVYELKKTDDPAKRAQRRLMEKYNIKDPLAEELARDRERQARELSGVRHGKVAAYLARVAVGVKPTDARGGPDAADRADSEAAGGAAQRARGAASPGPHAGAPEAGEESGGAVRGARAARTGRPLTLGELMAQGRFGGASGGGGEEAPSLGSEDEGRRMAAFVYSHPLLGKRVQESGMPEEEARSLVEEMKRVRQLMRSAEAGAAPGKDTGANGGGAGSAGGGGAAVRK